MNLALRVARFELAMIQELGYSPVLDVCAACTRSLADDEPGLAFAATVGGILCRGCQPAHRDRLAISGGAVRLLRELTRPGAAWQTACPPSLRGELRRILGYYVSSLMGKRPRLLPYLQRFRRGAAPGRERERLDAASGWDGCIYGTLRFRTLIPRRRAGGLRRGVRSIPWHRNRPIP